MERNTKLRYPMPTVEAILNSEYFLGPEAKSIRPYLKKKILDYFSGDKREFIFSGSSRSGKSYAACIIIIIYIIMIYCYESFPSLFGLSPTTLPKIYWFSFSRAKADSTGIDRLIRMIDRIPFFNDSPDRKRRDLTSMVSFSWVEVYSGTNVNHAVGDDVLGAIIDEANVRHVAKSRELEEAHELFMEIRMRSVTTYAYQGIWGGFAGIISTAASTSSFVDSELAKAKVDGSKFIMQAAVYDVFPEGYSKEKFKVYVGDGDIPPFILDSISPEIKLQIANNYGCTFEQYTESHSDLVISVPVSLRKFYEEDLPKAISNLSGISQVSSSNLFNRHSIIEGMFDSDLHNPCSVVMPNLGIYDTDIISELLSEQEVFRYYDGEPVYGHNDISKKNDHTGIAYLYYSTRLHRIMPLYYSAIYYNRSIPDNEIDQTKVFGILVALVKLGANIQYVSADFYASDYFIQQAKMLLGNDKAGRLSVDTTPAAYLNLLNFARKKMISLYPYKQLDYELTHLQYDRMTGKVDHPHNADSENPTFWKDVSDAVAGSVFHIMAREQISYEDQIIRDEASKLKDLPQEEEDLEDFYNDLADDSEVSFYGELASDFHNNDTLDLEDPEDEIVQFEKSLLDI